MDGRLTGAFVHRSKDAPALADAAADFVARTLARAQAERGTARFTLAGGSTPRATYERLAASGAVHGLDWSRVEVFFGDERAVPPEDPASNYRMAKESLLAKVAIPAGRVHRMEGELPPAEAASRYATVLGDAPLDVVLLGMGDDGHVASLFPGTDAPESTRRVLASRAPVAPHDRITLGLGVLNAARAVALLVSGAGKAARLAEVFRERSAGRPVLPAARVSPSHGELHFFLDEAAAAELAAGEHE